MNVTINDPGMTTTNTTTTTTTSHSSHSSNTTHNSNSNSDNNCRGWAMKQTDFAAAKKTITEASFEATKLSTAKSITSANCLSCDQLLPFAIFSVLKNQNWNLQNMRLSTQSIQKIILR
jgi:hypothetical protein